ncbi:hypothetical protein GTY96_29425 [Corallococcus sp. c25j21]|nr:hypothetical protein [Corallococcus silvisoli]
MVRERVEDGPVKAGEGGLRAGKKLGLGQRHARILAARNTVRASPVRCFLSRRGHGRLTGGVSRLATDLVLAEHRSVFSLPPASSRDSSASASPPPPRVLADAFVRTRVHEGALVLGAALCTAVLAQVAIAVPGSPVPITGQTLAVVLTAAALGPGRGMAAQLVYLLLGAVGLPFYAKAASGWGSLVGPTGGYLVAFLPAAWLVGLAARRGLDRRPWTAVAVFLVGQLVILCIGMGWLQVAASLDLATAFHKGFLPFVPGGVLKAAIAALSTSLAWRLARARASRAMAR